MEVKPFYGEMEVKPFYGEMEVKPFRDPSFRELSPIQERDRLSTVGRRVACYDHDAGRRWITCSFRCFAILHIKREQR